MSHAFFWLPVGYRWPLFLCLFATTFFLWGKLAESGKPLQGGGINYQFAWTRDRAAGILRVWNEARDVERCLTLKEIAHQHLRLDLWFLIFYPLLLSLSCAMLAESQSQRLALVGFSLSWVVPFAGIFDAIETVALLRMLTDGASTGLAQLAGWCASVKFLLLLAALSYIIPLSGLILLREIARHL